MNGLAGIGGPPVTLYWLMQRKLAEILRANIILSFAVIHCATGAAYYWQGLIGAETLLRTFALTPPFLLGAWIGAHYFDKSSERLFMRIVVALLIAVALATLVI